MKALPRWTFPIFLDDMNTERRTSLKKSWFIRVSVWHAYQTAGFSPVISVASLMDGWNKTAFLEIQPTLTSADETQGVFVPFLPRSLMLTLCSSWNKAAHWPRYVFFLGYLPHVGQSVLHPLWAQSLIFLTSLCSEFVMILHFFKLLARITYM